MLPDDLKFYAQIAGDVLMACTLGVSIFTLIHTSSKKRIEDIRKAIGDGDVALKKEHDTFREICERRATIASNRISEIDRRVSILETHVKGLPNHNDLQRISAGVSDLQSDVAANTERTNATFDMVRSIQNFLMRAKS